MLTIGEYLAPDPPTVTISGVTITGGLVTTSPASESYGKQGVVAFGGGIEVSSSADGGPGAALTVKDSVITGNRAAPTATVPSQVAACPGGDSCPFAWAKGGGIDTAGPLTLKNTVVSDITAGGVASDAIGGGISVWPTGSLTLLNSRVSGNRAVVGKPNGRFAEGGGIWQGLIFNEEGLPISLALERTLVIGNRVSGSSGIDVAGGGVFSDDFPVSLDRSRIVGNSPDQCQGC